MKELLVICGMALSVVTLATDGSVMATGSFAGTYDIYTTSDAKYAVLSAAELAALMPITYRVGETVAVIDRNGESNPLIASAAVVDGSVAFMPSSSGVWTFVNSEQGMARIGVAWAVNDETGSVLASGSGVQNYIIDSMQDGPCRKSNERTLPPIAYSGDDWCDRGASATSSLTVTPPAGKGGVIVYDSLSGTGVQPFPFDKAGKWTVALAMEDGTVRTAIINISGGFVITFN